MDTSIIQSKITEKFKSNSEWLLHTSNSNKQTTKSKTKPTQLINVTTAINNRCHTAPNRMHRKCNEKFSTAQLQINTYTHTHTRYTYSNRVRIYNIYVYDSPDTLCRYITTISHIYVCVSGRPLSPTGLPI